MRFIEKNLSANERILYKAKIHWFIYVRGLFFIILGFLVGKASPAASGFLFLVGLVIILMAVIVAQTTEFAVTNRRVVLKTGVTSRKVTELQLNKSEGLQISEGIIGRMFGYGTVKVTTGGVAESVRFLAKPFEFKKQVNNAIEGAFPGGAGQAIV
jgi:uncharacterized membrane protein YdbT with pleckstrin-like domain